MLRLDTGAGILAVIILFFVLVYSGPLLIMCIRDGCPAFNVDLGGAVYDR